VFITCSANDSLAVNSNERTMMMMMLIIMFLELLVISQICKVSIDLLQVLVYADAASTGLLSSPRIGHVQPCVEGFKDQVCCFC